MPAKLGILFLGVTVGGATFLVAGFACSLIIANSNIALCKLGSRRLRSKQTRFPPQPRMLRSSATSGSPMHLRVLRHEGVRATPTGSRLGGTR